MELDEIVARESIRELGARYAHAVDQGRLHDVAGCFARDGVLEVVDRGTATGAEAIVALLSGVGRELEAGTVVPRIRHQVTSVSIEVDGPDSARSWSYFTALTERGPDHWGRYTDLLVRQDGRWRYAHRRVRTEGHAPDGWAAATHRPDR